MTESLSLELNSMLIEVLKHEFSERCRRNPQYSLRAFARSLKIHSSTLSAILNNKRKITPKSAQKLLDELEVDAVEKKKIFLSLIEGQQDQGKPQYHILDDETLSIICDWEHFAVLSLLELEEKNKNPGWIANRLNIPLGIVLETLSRLERAELAKLENGNWIATGKNCATKTDIPNSSIRKVHRQYIEKALYSLDQHSVDERDITGITMAINSKKLPMAKKMIADFRRELAAVLECDPKDEVYRLNLQLFPLKK